MTEGKFDEMKGRAKEAIGDLTDDDHLKDEGKVDKATGSVKDSYRYRDVLRRVVGRDRCGGVAVMGLRSGATIPGGPNRQLAASASQKNGKAKHPRPAARNDTLPLW
jgi:uncharacterized protein YjbJ (UPF0337 family)